MYYEANRILKRGINTYIYKFNFIILIILLQVGYAHESPCLQEPEASKSPGAEGRGTWQPPDAGAMNQTQVF